MATPTPPPAAANPLVAMLANRSTASAFAATLGRYGSRGILLLARAYLGPLAGRSTVAVRSEGNENVASGTNKGLSSAELALLGLAVAKLAFELGELALHNPEIRADGHMPEFKLDDEGRAPALSVAHVVAAMRWLDTRSAQRAEATSSRSARVVSSSTTLMAARAARYATSSRYSYATGTSSRVPGAVMTKSPSRGCSSCGGHHPPATPSAQPAPTTRGCGCGNGRGCTCGTRALATRTYDREQCPTFAISCETKTALRDCVKIALCDFLRAVSETLCPDGRFDSNVFNDPTLGKQLIDDVGQLACSFVHCVPDALCGPTCEAAPPETDCPPCDYAVETQR